MNMKTIVSNCLLLTLVTLISCNDDEKEYGPLPFDQFSFSAQFTLPSDRPNSFEDLTLFHVSAQKEETGYNSESYRYYIDGSIIPSGHAMTVKTSGDIVTFLAFGNIARSGTQPPATFTGDEEQWSESCQYEYKVTVDAESKTVTSAKLVISSSKYKKTFDLKDKITFDDYMMNGKRLWSINNVGHGSIGELSFIGVSFWAIEVK